MRRIVRDKLYPLLSASLAVPTPLFAAAIEEIIITESVGAGYLESQSSLPKFTESLLDTPQSITTITSDMLEDRGVMNLDDALRNIPGITLGAGEFSWQGSSPTIRGFSALNDMYLDGMRDLGYYTRDPFNAASIEVLQGPSSTAFGRGSTGGVINQNSKKPFLENSLRSLHVNVGNADTKRFTVDVSQPLGANGDSAFRVNALYHESGVPGRDAVETERKGIAPSLSLGLGSATRLTLSYLRLTGDSIPDYGLPWVGGEPANVDRSNYYGFDDDYVETEANVFNASLDHRFNEAFSVNGMLRVGDYSRRSRITEPQVSPSVTPVTPPETVTVDRFMFSGESDEGIVQGQVNLRADFSTADLAHTVVTGFEISREHSEPAFGFAGQTPFVDFGLPTPSTNLANPEGIFTGTTANRLQADTRSDTLAAFLLDTIKFSERWQLMLGLRWDRFETDYKEWRYNEVGTLESSAQYITKDIETSYRAALVFKPVPDATVYLGWGTSFNPSSEAVSFISSGRGLGTSNVFLQPEENDSVELGAKWAFMGNRLLLDAALFRISKNNARVPDPANPGSNTLAGEQLVNGFSINLTGRIDDSLQVVAGYAYLDGQQKNGLNGSASDIQNLAEKSYSVWADWSPRAKLNVGVGARYLDERLAAIAKPVDSYWVMDAMAKYAWSENVEFKVNLTNITDEYYIDQIHPWHIVPGPGFGAVFAVNLDY